MAESGMTAGPLPAYRELINAGAIRSDQEQLLAAEKLQVLTNRLATYKPPRGSDLYSFFTRRRGTAPEGLYLFGGVGRGKTMLMDLFFETVTFEPKRRIHFHEFMTEVHDTIADYRKSQDGDPIPAVAKHILSTARLLCFDELHVTDIADAMILGRLFSGLFEEDLIIVATSNVPPSELYKDGLNRQLFLPFVELIEDRMEVFALDAGTDYRLEKLRGHDVYFTPVDRNARQAMDIVWQKLIGRSQGAPCSLTVKSREIKVSE
ncbi:MAG: cell division protein ZapE, partial [Methyloligellaceae bacterium]